jgi:hypothetical protein
MNGHSLSVVGIGEPAKICRAVVVSAGLIFASSTCGNAEDAWSQIKASAQQWKETSDYFVATRDDIEIVTKVPELLGIINTTDDSKRFDELEMKITLGFRDVRWATARAWIAEAQNKSLGGDEQYTREEPE